MDKLDIKLLKNCFRNAQRFKRKKERERARVDKSGGQTDFLFSLDRLNNLIDI